MTWVDSDGDRLYNDDMVDLLEYKFNDQLYDRFVQSFNQNSTPIEVVERYGGRQAVNWEFRKWLSGFISDKPEVVARMTGYRRVNPRTSQSRKTNSGCKGKGSCNSKPKSKASAQPRKANGQFAKKPRTSRGSSNRRR